jgi:hypothetical protein
MKPPWKSGALLEIAIVAAVLTTFFVLRQVFGFG